MRTTRIVRLGALGVMLGALPAATTSAQEPVTGVQTVQLARPAFEPFYTRIRFDSDRGRMNAEGVGARFMWRGSSLFEPTSPLAGHLDLGVFGSYTPKRTFFSKLDAATYHVGLAADVRPFSAPLAGRVDPFASLGLGVLSTRVSRGLSPAPSPLFRDSGSAITLAPGVGARLLLSSYLGVQGDVRDVVAFNEGARHNPAFSAGVSLRF
jgi:hypothetical protein